MPRTRPPGMPKLEPRQSSREPRDREQISCSQTGLQDQAEFSWGKDSLWFIYGTGRRDAGNV